MAERRMFAKTIIDSDAFLEMPLSTQALYFHLSMRADDEGFLNNSKRIMRMVGASEDDLKLLIAKRFIIPFDSGVIVIKHWKIHNYIRGDRLQKTQYQEERQLLEEKEGGAYTIIKNLNELPGPMKREKAYREGTLPYSFTYKIKRAFAGKECPSCGRIMHSGVDSAKPTIQHNIPISKGGTHTIDNISIICSSCNYSIKDKETGSLNNDEVVKMWNKILYADAHRIKWFYNEELLENIDIDDMSGTCQSTDSHMSDTCQPDVSIGKVRLGKYSLDKVSVSKLSEDNSSGVDNVDNVENIDLSKYTNQLHVTE